MPGGVQFGLVNGWLVLDDLPVPLTSAGLLSFLLSCLQALIFSKGCFHFFTFVGSPEFPYGPFLECSSSLFVPVGCTISHVLQLRIKGLSCNPNSVPVIEYIPSPFALRTHD